MTRKSYLFDEDVILRAISELENFKNHYYVRRKLEAVIAASKHGMSATAKIYNTTIKSIRQWTLHIRNSEIHRLKGHPNRKPKAKLNEEQLVIIKSWINANPNITINSLRIRIKEELGVTISMTTTDRYIKKLKFSYITPRPVHHKQETEITEESKKKSNQ